MVEGGQGNQHADRDDGARESVSHRGQTRRPSHGRRRVKPAGVAQRQRENAGDGGGDDREGEGGRHRSSKRGGARPHSGGLACPHEQLADRYDEAHAEGRGTGGGSAGRRPAAQSHPRQAVTARWPLSEPGAPAQAPLEGEETQREEQKEARELGGGGAIEETVPYAVDRLRECAVPE